MKNSAMTENRIVKESAYDGGERRSMLLEDAQAEAKDSAKELDIDIELAQSLVPLNSLTDTHLTELLHNSTVEVVFRGQAIFESGSYDREHIYLLSGDVELLDNHSNATLVRAGGSLTPLAHEQPRSCRAMAKSDCSILRVDSEYLDKMLTWSQVAEYLLLDISYQRDLDEDAEWMMTILKSNLFYKVPPTNAPVIFDRLHTMLVSPGEAIIRQGEIGDNCYFIKQGDAEVRRSPDGMTPPVHIANIGAGRCFGEDALVNETVRNASVFMKSHGVLMYITKRDFLKLLREPKVPTADVEETAQLIEDGAICIDLRTVEEYDEGHLEHAINIPLNLLRIKTRLLDKNTQYVLYCDTGRRSKAAAHLLKKSRFNVVALEGGLKEASKSRSLSFKGSTHGYILRDGQVLENQD
ncbi:cyclic nucleotide-binding domain-containing protein [Aurantivibrio plasticivorans]